MLRALGVEARRRLAAALGLLALLPVTRAGFAAFGAMAVCGLAYRLRLFFALRSEAVKPFSFDPNLHHVFEFIGDLRRDLIVAALLVLLVALVMLPLARAARRLERVYTPLAITGWLMLVLAFAVAADTHFHLIFAMHTGLGVAELTEASGALSVAEFLSYITAPELAFLGLPLLTYPLVLRLTAERPRLAAKILAVTAVVVIASHLAPHTRGGFDAVLRRNALEHAAVEIRQYLARGQHYARLPVELSAEQRRSLALVDPKLAHPAQGLAAAPAKLERHVTNVVLVILESTGEPYVFGDQSLEQRTMPFLRSLAEKSLLLTQHYATANTSPRAIFSLLSGLYPPPERAMVVTGPNVVAPTLHSLAGPRFASLLVTPGRLEHFFPMAFLKNGGLQELYGYYNLPLERHRPSPNDARSELDVADYFVERLASRAEPFIDIYYSFAPHYHYFDYGPEYDVVPRDGSRLHAYYSNLRVLDQQLEKIVRALETRGIAERTLVVMVGDHGEGFGQHAGNWGHSRGSYEENLRVPALFYAPGVLTPARVERPTSHVDILPTTLEVLGVDYDAGAFQGESALALTARRKLVFAWGSEEILSSQGPERAKMQVSFKDDACWWFDLHADPHEQVRRSCTERPEQLEAMLAYRKHQLELVKAAIVGRR